ncbi:extracellular catalytic domain type 1 short-chain-length polyhydroxyalkanoate depolymerase [Pseudoduganella armeniaca]|nr:PHB depolymerase family esterase [Pseudoduganella armeniaca]
MARPSGRTGGGAALFRSLAKLGRTQQKAAGKVMAGLLSLPAVTAPPVRKVARKPAAPRARAPVVAPGKWLASQEVVAVPGLPPRRMRYWLYLPHVVPEQAQIDGLPLVLMLHGCHQSATEFAEGTRMNLLAEQQGYAVLYPQQSASVHAQRCWRWFDRATQQGGGDVQPIAAVLARVLERYRIDRRRIYACGISAGAGMAHILALNFPDLFAAVGLHSGPVFGAGNGALGALGVMRHGGGTRAEAAVAEVLARRPDFPGMPTLVIQGAGDTVVRSVNQDQLVRQALLLNGLPAETPPRIKIAPAGRRGGRNGHEVRDYHRGRKLVVRAAHIDVLEHAWSGGDPRLAFNAKAGPDSSRMMLAFFAKQRR